MKLKNMYPSDEELENVKREGVVELDKLKVGTVILLETNKHVFEFTIEENKIYVSSSNIEIISGRCQCKITGCINEDGMLFAGLIARNKHLIFALKGRGRYVTGLVKSLSLHGPGWTYELLPRPEGKIIGEK
jgi:hypothetical protein